jgi:hypothetical protein
LVFIVWVYQCSCGLKKYGINLFGLDVDRQSFNQPKGDLLDVLTCLFILLWMVRFWTGETDGFNDFLENWVFSSQEFRIKVCDCEKVIAAGSSQFVWKFFVSDDFITDPESDFFRDLESSFNHGVQDFKGLQWEVFGPLLSGPDLDEFKWKWRIDVLSLDDGVNALDGFIDEFLYFEGIEEVKVKLFGRFEVVKETVEEDKGSCGLGGWSNGFIEKGLKLDPVFNFDDWKQNADENGDTFLHQQVRFLNVLGKQQIPEVFLFVRINVAIQIDKVAFEQYGGHLPKSKFLGID